MLNSIYIAATRSSLGVSLNVRLMRRTAALYLPGHATFLRPLNEIALMVEPTRSMLLSILRPDMVDSLVECICSSSFNTSVCGYRFSCFTFHFLYFQTPHVGALDYPVFFLFILSNSFYPCCVVIYFSKIVKHITKYFFSSNLKQNLLQILIKNDIVLLLLLLHLFLIFYL